jgi:hypothetical protein
LSFHDFFPKKMTRANATRSNTLRGYFAAAWHRAIRFKPTAPRKQGCVGAFRCYPFCAPRFVRHPAPPSAVGQTTKNSDLWSLLSK